MRTVNPRTLTNEQLADRFGALKGRMAALDEVLEGLKKDFLRRGFALVDGKKYRLTRTEARTDLILNIEAIRASMSEAWISRHVKDKPVRAGCKVSAITSKRHSRPVKRTEAPAEHELELAE